MQELARFCAGVDGVFNRLGYIPVVSSFTGPIGRAMVWASIQVSVAGAIMFVARPLGVFAALVGEKAFAGQCMDWVRFSAHLANNAASNYMRGLYEVIPVWSNLTCYLYDKALNGVPIIPYMPSVSSWAGPSSLPVCLIAAAA